jgi:hypothetical protein
MLTAEALRNIEEKTRSSCYIDVRVVFQIEHYSEWENEWETSVYVPEKVSLRAY